MRHHLVGLISLAMFSVTSNVLADELRRDQDSFFLSNIENTEEPIYLAQADTQKGSGQDADAGVDGQKSEQCVSFAKDPNADLGAVLKAGCQPTLGQMSALMDNPLGNVAMLFTQFDLNKMEDPTSGREANIGIYTGILQFPKKLNENWNLINRFIWTVPSMPLDQGRIDAFKLSLGPGGAPLAPGPAPIDLFDGRTTGLGDSYYVGLFAPSKGIDVGDGRFLWGAGFDLQFPTATEDILGTDKWAAGPSALGVYMGPKWKVGALGMHYWDFAGVGGNEDALTLTNLQYFIYYSLNDTTSIGAAPNIIIDWEQNDDNKLTLPVGIGINKTFQFGKVPVRIGAEMYTSVIQPDDVVGTKWAFRFFIIPAAPSALFGFMQ